MQIIASLPGWRVYPTLQLTVGAKPVKPPFVGDMLAAFVMECVPVQLLAEICQYYSILAY